VANDSAKFPTLVREIAHLKLTFVGYLANAQPSIKKPLASAQGILLAHLNLVNKKKKEVLLPKLLSESQSLLMLFEKREEEIMEARGRGEKAA